MIMEGGCLEAGFRVLFRGSPLNVFSTVALWETFYDRRRHISVQVYWYAEIGRKCFYL